jgi:cell division protease FtsH
MRAGAATELPSTRLFLPRPVDTRGGDAAVGLAAAVAARSMAAAWQPSVRACERTRCEEEMKVDGPERPSASDPARTRDARNRPRFAWRNVGVFVGLLLLNYLIVSLLFSRAPNPHVEIPYRPTFVEQLRDANVATVTAKGTTVEGTFEKAVRYPDDEAVATTRFSTEVPEFANRQELDNLLEKNGVEVIAEPTTRDTPLWQTFLVYLGPTLIFFGLWYAIMHRAGAAGGGMLGFGRAKAKQYEPTAQRITFADVAGIEGAEQELAEVVDFLRDPAKYTKLGARIPRGVLLSGAPGTGKTLLARAVAGEAGVPFFSMSASEFVEMIVGVGASRVRDLFAQAKATAPSIIFVDEIDAIGRSRGSGVFSGANDEREQTLNQILTEMDGFDATTGVIVLAATNRPDVLDPALLRPGRFDRRVTIQAPDKEGREQILHVHTRSVPLAPDVNLSALAATTVGMVGADLANLVNEAALLAARRRHEQVGMSDFSDSLEKIVLGAERKIVLREADRQRTAYHEAGHALVSMLTPGADPVRKISIIPRSRSLGVTLSAPDTDQFNYDKQGLLARIRVATGGRAAEEVVYSDQTTGAESDIRQATQLARQMVGRFGMSEEIGFVAVLPQDGEASALQGLTEVSERTRQSVDVEVKRIVGEAHDEAIQLLSQHRERLDALATALLRAETLDQPDAYGAAGLPAPEAQAPTVDLAPADAV